jgi:hypothetical protein
MLRDAHLEALARALGAGNVEAAEKAFCALVHASVRQKQMPPAAVVTGGAWDIQLQTIDTALRSGDVVAAQQAFAVLLRAAGPQRPRSRKQTDPVIDIQV